MSRSKLGRHFCLENLKCTIKEMERAKQGALIVVPWQKCTVFGKIHIK